MAKPQIAARGESKAEETNLKAVSLPGGKAGKNWRRKLEPYLWLFPALLLYAIFKILPMVAGIWLSLLRWDGIDDAVFVGLRNFQNLFSDPNLGPALWHNVEYALGTVTGKIVLSLLLAVLLNQSLRGRGIYRTSLFLPVAMSFVVVALLWSWLYDYQFGLIDNFLRLIGLKALAVDWLGNTKTALWAEIGVDIWKWYGFHMVIFLAALQTIPQELYEAAQVDGASRLARFFHITLPLLQPAMLINVTISLMGALNAFDIPYLMTTGGPDNATNVLALQSYMDAFKFNELGYGSALSYALFVFIAVLAIIQIRFMAPRDVVLGGRE
jgi:raffinose/stachyose/melibiose transport system permease protein